MASIAELLSTKITTGVISREAGINQYLLRRFGMNPGGFAENPVGHRQFGYDIFNDTRTVSQGRAPGVAAATITRQKVGRVNGTFPRFYEKLPLMGEELHNYRVIGGPSNVFDEGGARYIERQQRFLGQRMGNNRMALLAGMFRGKMYAHQSGDTIYYDFTSSGAIFELNWQTPADNKDQLNGLITKTWSDPTADIPGNLRNLNARLQSTLGTTLDQIICPVNVWNYISTNDNVQAQAGIGQPPWQTFRREVGVDANGQPQTVLIGVITAFPMVEFVITNETLKLGIQGSETSTQYIDDNCMWWGPNASRRYFEMLLGSEPVSEGYGRPERIAMGMTGWTKLVDDPAGRMMFSLDNCIPAAYVPAASGYATVVF